jgi:hypothetical protein
MILAVHRASEDDVYKDIARVAEIYRKDRKRKTIPEGTLCKVSLSDSKAYAILRGKADSNQPYIWLDERTRNRLGVNLGDECDFEFEKVGIFGQVCWACTASDLAYRVAGRLAVLSILLGLLGLALGILSLWLTLRSA